MTLSRAVTPSQSKETVLSAFTTWRPDQSTIGFPAGMMDVAEVLNTAPERSATARPYCCIFGCVMSLSGRSSRSPEKKVRITSSSNLPGWFADLPRSRASFSRALAVQALVAGRSWQPKPAFERTEGQPGLAACFWVTVTGDRPVLTSRSTPSYPPPNQPPTRHPPSVQLCAGCPSHPWQRFTRLQRVAPLRLKTNFLAIDPSNIASYCSSRTASWRVPVEVHRPYRLLCGCTHPSCVHADR